MHKLAYVKCLFLVIIDCTMPFSMILQNVWVHQISLCADTRCIYSRPLQYSLRLCKDLTERFILKVICHNRPHRIVEPNREINLTSKSKIRWFWTHLTTSSQIWADLHSPSMNATPFYMVHLNYWQAFLCVDVWHSRESSRMTLPANLSLCCLMKYIEKRVSKKTSPAIRADVQTVGR